MGESRWTIKWLLNYEGHQHVSVEGERPEYDQEDDYNGHAMNRWVEVEVVPLAALEDARDRLVEAWHYGAGGALELHEYLGMTWDEYARWVVS